jgi:alpha-tubulin suppressor-like RCC1 family protein
MSLVFNNNLDTTDITNVLLIDRDTVSYNTFYDSCNESTFPIVYSSNCNRNDLLTLLSDKFTKINRLGFVFSFQPVYIFLNNENLFTDNEATPYSKNVTFIIELINKFNISNIDYLACDTLNYENWKNYYNIILSNTTSIVGASSDKTGNIKYGGDWTMESTGQDVEFIYFNSNIQNYQHLLDSTASSLFVMNDGSVYGTGYNAGGYLGLGFHSNGQYGLAKMINNTGKTAAAISGGRFHVVVLMTDGTIYGCGESQFGQLGLGPSITTSQFTIAQMINNTGKTPKAISCGERHTIVLMTDGTIYACGLNDGNQLGFQSGTIFTLTQIPNNTGKTPVEITTGSRNTFVLMSDGTLYGAGALTPLGIGSQTYVRGLNLIPNNTGKTPVAVSSCSSHTIIVMSDGTIYATGSNAYGQLGIGNTTSQSVFVQMNNTTGKLAVGAATAGDRTHILMSDRTIYSCGFNNVGQLGIGTTGTGAVTNLVQLINNTGKTPVAVSTASSHIVVLMSDGTIYAAGANTYGELGLSHTISLRSSIVIMPNNTGLIPISMLNESLFQLTTRLSNFVIQTKTLSDSPFQITPPSSTNVNGLFSYVSSDESVATISGDMITIVGAGQAIITASQPATETYTSATITTSFQVSKTTPSITNFAIPTRIFGNTSFAINPPSSNSNGSFSYTSSDESVATISGNRITIVGAGTTTITATQAETSIYTSGSVTATFQVIKATPSITSFSIPTKIFGNNAFTISQPVTNSNGSFSYISSNTSVATISGNTITIVGAGNATITATQAATTNFNSQTITTSFQVNKATPSITGFSIPTKTFGDSSFQIQKPPSNSDGSFNYLSSNTSVATISGDNITIVGPGTSTITANQLETANYTAIKVTASFQVNKSTPSMPSFSIPTKIFGDGAFTIDLSGSDSNGSFSYTSSNSSVATISGNTITIVGAGSTTITATQAETIYYTSGTVTASLQVNKATPTISTFSIPIKIFGDTPFTINRPISNSDGSFNYISSDESVATISGNTITIVGSGTAMITATQTATTNYNSRTITTLFQVNKATPSITSFSIPIKTYGDGSFKIPKPFSSIDGSFSYTSSNTSVATISGDMITIVGAGTSIITATQMASSSYNSITITTSFQVNKATPSIPSFSIQNKIFGDSPFTVDISGSNSDGSFNYVSSDTSVATVSGNTITIVGTGSVTIIATQSSTSNFTSGTTTASFQVNQPSKPIPSIGSLSIGSKTYGDLSFNINNPESNSNGSFSYISSDSSVATISGNTITIVGAGTAAITATQAATTNYASITTTALFQVNKANPSIPSFSISPKTFGDSAFNINISGSNSDGSFSYSSSNTSVATISGNTITIVGAGTATITATQSATPNYTSGTTTALLQVNKANPNIHTFSIGSKTYGEGSFTVTAPISNSNGSFTYSSSDESVATISGNTITIVGAGTTTITATQFETANYTSGTITTTFQVNNALPSITGFYIPIKKYDDVPFTITQPISNSDGSFSYISSEFSVATISGDIITISGIGTSTITATQSATTNYTLGTITAPLQVNNAELSLTNFSISSKTYNDNPFQITKPDSNSTGSFSYIISDTSVATISGDMITIVGTGIAIVTATQEATSSYPSGTIITSFEVNKLTPSLSNFSIQNKTYGDSPFQIEQPQTNSDGSFSYISSDTSIATISGNIVTIVGSGILTIIAIQSATKKYTSGTITTLFQVN